MVITRNHGVGQVPGVVEMNPTDLQELSKPSRDLGNLKKQDVYYFVYVLLWFTISVLVVIC